MDPLPTSMEDLDDYTKSYWLSGYDSEANEIVTVQTVMLAMRSMFWYRVSNNLEWAAIADMIMLPDIESCSEQTKEVGYEIMSAYYDGAGASLDLMNEEPFLMRANEWLQNRSG